MAFCSPIWCCGKDMRLPSANSFAPRTPWPVNFPRVAVHSDTALRDRHPAYENAKAGNEEAAFALAEDLLSAAVTDQLRQLIGAGPVILLPITALETTGFNAIPDAMAQVLGARPRAAGQLWRDRAKQHRRPHEGESVQPHGDAGRLRRQRPRRHRLSSD